MIQVTGVDKLHEQLRILAAEAEAEMTNMVMDTMQTLKEIAVKNTPIGDADENADMYAARQDFFLGMPLEEGFARASWKFVTQKYTGVGSATSIPDSQRKVFPGFSVSTVVNDNSMMNFRLGDRIVLRNDAYYISKAPWPYESKGIGLEENYSAQTGGQGIMKPTITEFLQVYKVNVSPIGGR